MKAKLFQTAKIINAIIAYLGSFNQFIGLIPTLPKIKLIIPYSELNNHDHTIPIATSDVTYGKKYILWSIPLTFSFFMFAKAFAINKDIITDKAGTIAA